MKRRRWARGILATVGEDERGDFFAGVVSKGDQRRRKNERGTVGTVEKTSAGTLVTAISGDEEVSAARWRPSRGRARALS